MTSAADGFAHEAVLVLDAGADARAPGGAVTAALCGSWDHDGECRWPHHTSVERVDGDLVVRVVWVASDVEQDEVREQVVQALTTDGRWTVTRHAVAPLTDADRRLGFLASG